MTESPFTKVTRFECKWADFDKFVSNIYNRDFSIVADQEAYNDITLSFTVDKYDEWGVYDEERLKEWVAGNDNDTHMTSIILIDLARRGIIQDGKYCINISW